MKLDTRRTFFIGLAFLSICAFWQLYNNVIPLILRDVFHVGDTLSGVIMSADNVAALFLLPLFGALSDKKVSRLGRRTPFILKGTAAAVVLMLLLPLCARGFFESGQRAFFWVFMAVLALLLLAMATYRSPAVALMSDLTPKPLRSRANAIINLMGTVGAGLYLVISAVLYSKTRTAGLRYVSYAPVFIIVAAVMVISTALLLLTVREKKLSAAAEEYEKAHPEENLAVDDGSGSAVLPRPVKRSLAFMLASIFLWFMGYNAVDTAFSKYATAVWDMSLGQANLCLTVSLAVAAAAYIPSGMLATRFGRKKTILAGCALMTAGFAAVYVCSLAFDSFSPVLFGLFAVVGVAYALTIVNTLPVVVEMCRGSDIGRFTGLYYTFSMAAQIITPIASGFLLEHVGYGTLFPYAALFAALSGAAMLGVRHGDGRRTAEK